jgi:hypothetical protein
MEEKEIGKITHYFGKVKVAVLALNEPLKVGEKVHFKGKHTDFSQAVASLQLDHAAIPEGAPGQDVAMLVDSPVHEGDLVFRVTE